jgi:hypothetical protein
MKIKSKNEYVFVWGNFLRGKEYEGSFSFISCVIFFLKTVLTHDQNEAWSVFTAQISNPSYLGVLFYEIHGNETCMGNRIKKV